MLSSFESKRGLVSQFHKVSEKQLDRYLDEVTDRLNGRDDDRVYQKTLRNLVNGRALTFDKLVTGDKAQAAIQQ